jgi:predicted nucleic acid-binding protein
LADALIAAAAANRDAVLVHRDPHFDALPAEDLRQEKL